MSALCCLGRMAGCSWAGGPGLAAAWQLPQGGIDEGEDPRVAVLRELQEEVGTEKAEIIGEHPEWLQYDLPPELLGVAWNGKYRGQRQKWFALSYLGPRCAISGWTPMRILNSMRGNGWHWLSCQALRLRSSATIYEVIARDFAVYARPYT